jgi:heme-degrading monooxygenase HmoA
MTISILIQRKINQNEKAEKLAPLIVKLRSLAAGQQGYLTGKTYRSLDRKGEYLVISTWSSLGAWKRWRDSEERMEIQKQIDDLLDEETQYRVYEPLFGGIIPTSDTIVY